MPPTSAFTYRDLKLLAQSSPDSPLRVIALVDFDAFYAQCETVRRGLPPDQPLAVQQWNAIIALNYPAKKRGLKRGISVEEAKATCPGLILQHVATRREGETGWAYRPDVLQHMKTDKAALDPYRLESRKTFKLVHELLPPPPIQRIEKAGVDEFFLDLSAQVHSILLERHPYLHPESHAPDDPLPAPDTSVLDWSTDHLVPLDPTAEEDINPPDWDDFTLHIGASIVRSLRQSILTTLHYTTSAGLARTKSLAKLAASAHKPACQTVVRTAATPAFLATHKFTKIRGLARSLGSQVVAAFNTDRVSDLLAVPLSSLVAELGPEQGAWAHGVIRGIDTSEVVPRTALRSMLAQKTFVPPLRGPQEAEKWLRTFARDLCARMEEQYAEGFERRPGRVALHHHIRGRFGPTRSKQMGIPAGVKIGEEMLVGMLRVLLGRVEEEGVSWPCMALGVSLGGFGEEEKEGRIEDFFGKRKLSVNERDEGPRKMGVAPSERSRSGEGDLEAFDGERRVLLGSGEREKRVAAGNEYQCPHCEEAVPSEQVLEHLDWHVALELQSGAEDAGG
ncbi:N-acetyltransferase-like protein 6 [Elsinoe australis]|uniref:DNA polymerase eta n=1 Tax=Elsinoe australis TaxID=40998 RepID=A0A4U7AYF1_9PEZI|nr:N-acetyltransferase-like protein 6 [Elsinoe australis]